VKPVVIIAVLLIVFGVFALAYRGLSYDKTEQVAEIGPLELKTETTETIPLPPIVGASAVVGGVVLLVVGLRRR